MILEESYPACAECDTRLPASFFNSGLRLCPTCGYQCRADVFPALYAPDRVASGEKLLIEEESGCFYHPGNKAIVPCDSCGRFLCQLCQIDLGDRHLCPQCVQTGRNKGKIRDIENHCVLYDSVALSLAIVPIFFFMPFYFFTIFTAPGAIFLTVKHWRKPLSIVPRTKFRFVVAFSVALLQICGWVFFAIFYLRKNFA